jgi:hypothetical protein
MYESKAPDFPRIRVVGAPGYEDFEALQLGIFNGDRSVVLCVCPDREIIVVRNEYVVL